MILGLGTDLCDIRRIERTLDRFGDKFLARIFTDDERRVSASRHNPAAAYALRYAAKEACAKALGTGIRQGVYWRDLAVGNHPSGKPFMVLTGGAGETLRRLTPPGMTAAIDLSLTDEYPMTQAVVVISTVPSQRP